MFRFSTFSLSSLRPIAGSLACLVASPLLAPAAWAQAGGQQQQGGGLQMFIMLGGMMLIMYFLLIRPQKKRQKEHDTLVGSLQKGDEVVMTSGIVGKIKAVDDNYLTLKVSENVELKFQKVAVHAVLPKGTMKTIASE